MSSIPKEILDQLYDIEGIDPISWWPLAPGWWGCGMIVLILITLIFGYWYRRHRFSRSWQGRIGKRLLCLRKMASDHNGQAILSELSEIIRLVAIAKTSRLTCAGLEGQAWLVWLKENDPYHFDWVAQGQCLIEAPYAPTYTAIPPEKLTQLIQAIEKWVK